MSVCGLKLFAYTKDNFISQMREEGVDVSFVDQHENIILFSIGIIFIYIASKFIRTSDSKFAISFSGIILVLFAWVNMILGVPYGEYLVYAVPAVILSCILIYAIFSASKTCVTGRLFLCIPIFIGSLILMGLWSFFVDYKICDKNVQWPSEYGLQWRPIYEGFTDKNYYKSIEREVDSIDSDKKLENLLHNESHTIYHSFDILKNKGWKVGNTSRTQFFVNPNCEMGYVQVIRGGGLIPFYTRVMKIDEIFENLNLSHLKEIHLVGELNNNDFVAVTEDADSTCLYVSYDKNNNKEGEGFVCVRDSIISLPNWREIIPYESISGGSWFHVKPDYYVSKEYLKFPSDTIHGIDFDDKLGFVIRFNNPDAGDKLYAIDTFSLVRMIEDYYKQ